MVKRVIVLFTLLVISCTVKGDQDSGIGVATMEDEILQILRRRGRRVSA